MSNWTSDENSKGSPFFWVLFSAGTILALIYVLDQVTDADLMGHMWRQVSSFVS